MLILIWTTDGSVTTTCREKCDVIGAFQIVPDVHARRRLAPLLHRPQLPHTGLLVPADYRLDANRRTNTSRMSP